MAQENEDGQEKTEEPTEDRRDEFRKKGDVAISREFSSIFVLAGVVTFLTYLSPALIDQLKSLLKHQFRLLENIQITQDNFIAYSSDLWGNFLKIIIPIFILTSFLAAFSTFSQTRLNFAWKRLKPNFQKFNIFKGLARMVSGQALMELGKGLVKMASISTIAYLIIVSEWHKMPSLLNLTMQDSWEYWGEITKLLFWVVSGFLLLVAAADYLYNFISLENKMKMTKKEIKDDYKNKEVDPQLKGRMRRMQRDMLNQKTISDTESATALITNPTHYSIAIKYELGMDAPIVLAKGVDFVALRMREVAKQFDIPIIENRPLARTLYKTANAGDAIPQDLYKAISEVIRYVFKMKGISMNRQAN